MFKSVTTLVSYIQAGKLRALAVTTPKRSPLLPDVPAIAEFVPGYDANTWFGIAAPKQTPADIVDLLNKQINAGLTDPTSASAWPHSAPPRSSAALRISRKYSSATPRSGRR